MRKVVEHQTRHRNHLQIVHSRRRRQVSVYGVFRMKCEWNKTIKAAGFVLQFAEADKMVNALFRRFDMTIKHRRVRTNPHLVNRPRNIEPAIPGNLMPGNQWPRAFCKDFGSTTGTTSESG